MSEKSKYIENDFNEKWLRINNSKLFMELEVKIKSLGKESRMGLMDLARVEDKEDPRYIAIICGGLNGPGEWENYFHDMCKVIKVIPDSWVIDLDIDVLDDVWDLYVGFRKKNINEGASGYQPEDSDAYFDMFYDLSKHVFNEILKHLHKNLKVKNDGMVYTYLGMLNHLLHIEELQGAVHYNDKDLADKKTDNLAVKVLKLANKCYKYLESDTENKQGWKDFERYKDELDFQHRIFISYMKALNDKTETPIKQIHLHEGEELNKTKKKIFLTEGQLEYIKNNVNEDKFPVDPNKVLVVKKFLDDNFQKGGIAAIGEDGYPKTISIVALKGTDGSLLKNMDDKQLFYMLQDKFQHLYSDTLKRDKLLKQVIKDWYKGKISKNGLLTVNLI